jgi:hypothetical protein
MKIASRVDHVLVVLALGASALAPIACGGDVVVDGPPSESGSSVSSTGTGSTGTGSTGTGSTGTGPGDFCPAVTGVPTTCPSPYEVFEMLIDPGRGSCSEWSACHGEPPGAYGLYLPKNDVSLFFKNLYAFTDSNGMPYVNAQNPAESWILCSLTGAPGSIGMPPTAGLKDLADVDLVRSWLLCGALAP